MKEERKIKVIHISHESHSYFIGESKNKDLKKLMLGDWYSKTALQIKKYYPEIEIECWTPEKMEKTEKNFIFSGIKYRIFPTTFSLVYALDFSMPMLKALKQEVEKAEQKNIKLIIHLHEYHNLHGLLIATSFKKSYIIAQHHGGSWPWKHIKQTKRYRLFFPFFLIGQLWEYLALGNIKIYYALSSEEIAYLKKIAPDSRIKFQTMGIEDECFAKISRRGARKKLDLNEKDKILLFLGRINYIKGVKILLDAMKKLKDFKLKIIGFGPQEKEFKDYAKQNKISNVEFLGPIFGNKKLLYLSAADALVLPSSKEGAPVTVMEAMARNTPSIVSDVGGVRLMIRDGKNGVIIKSRDKKAIINAVKKITEKPIKNAFSYAQAYKWQDIVEKTIKDYKDI